MFSESTNHDLGQKLPTYLARDEKHTKENQENHRESYKKKEPKIDPYQNKNCI